METRVRIAGPYGFKDFKEFKDFKGFKDFGRLEIPTIACVSEVLCVTGLLAGCECVRVIGLSDSAFRRIMIFRKCAYGLQILTVLNILGF